MNTLIESVRERFPDAVSASHTHRGDATVVLCRTFLLDVARFLKEDPALQMNFLVDVTAVDYSAFGEPTYDDLLRRAAKPSYPMSHEQEEYGIWIVTELMKLVPAIRKKRI